MDEQTDSCSTVSIDEDDCNPLSPIFEIDESAEMQVEELAMDFQDPSRCGKIDARLNLDTSVENLEHSRPSDPETPPEVLRVRLNSLQSEYDELKEFTDLERQTYHSDCIPRNEMESLEEKFGVLNEKVQLLMRENSEYQRKLELKENEETSLKSELALAKCFQNKCISLLERMKMKIRENVKDDTIPQEAELLPPFSLSEICNENCKDSLDIKRFLHSLRDLDNLLEIHSSEKHNLQDKVDHLQSTIFQLNKKVESMSQEMVFYEHNFSLVKADSVKFQEKCVKIEKQLVEISDTLLLSENKLVQAEHLKELASSEICKLQSVINNTQDNIISVVSTLKSVVQSFYEDSDKYSLITHEELNTIENNLKNNQDLFSVSSTLAILAKKIHKVKNEIELKNKECLELQLYIDQLNSHFRQFEEEMKTRKEEIEYLALQINQNLPSRLLDLNNCFNCKDNEISELRSSLKVANEKVEELSNELSKTVLKMDQLNVLLTKNSLEKTNLEKEISNLKNCLTVDKVQTHLILSLKCVEDVIDSWDEKSNLSDLFSVLMENDHVRCLINLLMNEKTQSKFNEVAKKMKDKVLEYQENTDDLYSKLKNMTGVIGHLENENEQIRLEVSSLDKILRQGISNRVCNLEKVLYCTYQRKLGNELSNHYSRRDETAEGERQRNDLNPMSTHVSCDKPKKQIKNFNEATKSDDCLEPIICYFNEIETLIDTWNCSGNINVCDFTKSLNEKSLKYLDKCQNSQIIVDLSRILNKFEAKLMEFLQLNNQLLETVKICSLCRDHENKQDLIICAIDDFALMDNGLKDNSENDNCEEKIHRCNLAEEIINIKKLLSLEITSLDETEDEESLMCESVQNIFGKLMQIIMIKEQEMSYNIQKQQKEDILKFEQTIEKLNNKIKSLECWTNTLVSENDKIYSELSALKNLNSSLDYKLKALSNDINNKTLEIDIMRRKNLDLVSDNDSLTTDLDATKDIIGKYKYAVSCLEKDTELLNEEIIKKSNLIEELESKLSFNLKELDNVKSKINSKGNSILVALDKTNESQFSKAYVETSVVCSDIFEDQNENIQELKAALLEMLRKETDFIIKCLKNGGLSELFTCSSGNLDVLKDIIQNIGSKVSELEMSHLKNLQSIQTALDYKTKEMNDFKLSISKLFQDLDPSQALVGKVEMTSLQNEIDEINSEFACLSHTVEEFEVSARMGQNIVQDLRKTIHTVLNENKNMAKLILDLQKTIEHEQEKNYTINQINDSTKNENNMLLAKISLLENEIINLNVECTKLKTEMFSDLDVDFPRKMENSEKIIYINKILKQYAETQKACYNVTEELRFFGYHCELMLSYIQSLECKLSFATHQKEHLEKENALLKGQLTTQNMEINRFFSHLISKSPYVIKSQNQALEVISHIFNENNILKVKNVEYIRENKLKQEKTILLQKELTSLTKQNSSLKFEVNKFEESIRNLRSELRNERSKCHRRESISLAEGTQEKFDAAVQTDWSCCKKMQKKINEQKEKIDLLISKLNKTEKSQRSSLTSNPYNKQVSYLEGALGQAKDKIGRLHFALKQQESHNQELAEALKRHENCQQRLDNASKEIQNFGEMCSPKNNVCES